MYYKSTTLKIKDYALKSQELYKEIEGLEKGLYLESPAVNADLGWAIGGWCSS